MNKVIKNFLLACILCIPMCGATVAPGEVIQDHQLQIPLKPGGAYTTVIVDGLNSENLYTIKARTYGDVRSELMRLEDLVAHQICLLKSYDRNGKLVCQLVQLEPNQWVIRSSDMNPHRDLTWTLGLITKAYQGTPDLSPVCLSTQHRPPERFAINQGVHGWQHFGFELTECALWPSSKKPAQVQFAVVNNIFGLNKQIRVSFKNSSEEIGTDEKAAHLLFCVKDHDPIGCFEICNMLNALGIDRHESRTFNPDKRDELLNGLVDIIKFVAGISESVFPYLIHKADIAFHKSK